MQNRLTRQSIEVLVTSRATNEPSSSELGLAQVYEKLAQSQLVTIRVGSCANTYVLTQFNI
jgi:hypothetical protein